MDVCSEYDVLRGMELDLVCGDTAEHVACAGLALICFLILINLNVCNMVAMVF